MASASGWNCDPGVVSYKFLEELRVRLVKPGRAPQGLKPASFPGLTARLKLCPLETSCEPVSVQSEIYFDADRDRDWFAVFDGGVEAPVLHGFNGLLIQTEA